MPYRQFAMTPALERQMQLWNQWLEANRSIWALYAPWLQVTPWLMNAATTSQPDKIEKEALVDGVPDAFELQARTWNHLLEANKQFWSVFAWPGTDSLVGNGAVIAEEEGNAEEQAPHAASKSRARSKHH